MIKIETINSLVKLIRANKNREANSVGIVEISLIM